MSQTNKEYISAKKKAQEKANDTGMVYRVKKNNIFGGYDIGMVSKLEVHEIGIGELVYPETVAQK